MLFPHFSIVLEVIGACLLLVMIVYAVQLNRRLSRLQADKAHLQKLIVSFNQSTERAEASVLKLRAGATEAAESLQVNITKANQLRDDLAFMVDRANTLADRLESAIGAGRARAAPQQRRVAPEAAAAIHAATSTVREAPKPAARPAKKRTARPTAKQAARPAAKQPVRPTAKPAVRAAANSSVRSTPKAAARTAPKTERDRSAIMRALAGIR